MSKESKNIKLIIMDVDGVMTDGKVYYSSNGEMMKPFSVRDGFFIKHICPKMNIETAIISGGFPDIVKKRAEVMDISHVYVGFLDKKDAYDKIKNDLDLENEEIAYIGDDWFDWSAMKYAGLKGSPANAAKEIRDRSDYVTEAICGQGAVREFIEFILKRDNKFESAMSLYLD